MNEPMTDERQECGMCGGDMSRNPHPNAGGLETLSDVGAVWECIPCAVSGRSKAYWRAVKAEGEIDRLRAELAAKEAECERLRGALTGIADDVCWMGCTMRPPKEWKSQPRFQPVEHEEDCPKRMAYAALNPEAAE